MKNINFQTASPSAAISLENSDFYRDLPFLLIACLLHAFILTKNVGFNWSIPIPQAEKAVPIEIVQQVPNPALLAPMAPGTGKKDEAFHHGRGKIQVEKIKRGHPHHTAVKHKKAIDPAVIAAMHARKLERQHQMMERMMKEQERQRELAAQRAEQRRIEAEKRAEIARIKEEEHQKILAERARIEAERLAEQRRIQAEKLAALRQMQAQQKAQVESELASLPNPDEAISKADDATDAAVSPAGKTAAIGAALAADASIATGHGAAISADLQAEELDGNDGKDALNMKASGGGAGKGDGGPVSWSLEGPVGSRRLLKRVVPPCPEEVSRRGLDLVVTLKFRVLENGEIKEAIIVKKTSGFPNVDQLAMEALRRWKFQAYHAKDSAKAPAIWGVVSFRFVAA